MKKSGVRTRSLSASMTKYEKKPFLGNEEERGYLLGLRAGDLYAVAHGQSVRAVISTTHPAMVALMHSIFDKYGAVKTIPKPLPDSAFEWEVYAYLHPSFGFLCDKAARPSGAFLSFFAGFFDSEGTISIGPQHKSKTTSVRLDLDNCDLPLLSWCFDELAKLGYHPTMLNHPIRRKGTVVGYGPYGSDFWRLSIMRKSDALKLLSALPLRHGERLAMKELALRLHMMPWESVMPTVRGLRVR